MRHDEGATPEQERLAERLRATAAGVRAPQSLRARVAETRLEAPPGKERRQLAGDGLRGRGIASWPIFGAAATVVLAALVFGLVSIAGGDDVTVDQAARIALRAPVSAAPATRADGMLDAWVGPVWFPGKQKTGGWRPVGLRNATIDGRKMVTVTYARDGRVAAYAIVDDRLDGLGDDHYTVSRDGDATIVTWERDGRTCILVSANADAERLLAFARSGERAGAYG